MKNHFCKLSTKAVVCELKNKRVIAIAPVQKRLA